MKAPAQLLNKLTCLFTLWSDLVETLSTEDLSRHLGNLRSNSIGEQLWCVGGARESYGSALLEDSDFCWLCSYPFENAESYVQLAAYLNLWEQKISDFLKSNPDLSDNQFELIFDLLTHEAQHQGQLIRYIYGEGLPVPESWQSWWALDA